MNADNCSFSHDISEYPCIYKVGIGNCEDEACKFKYF